MHDEPEGHISADRASLRIVESAPFQGSPADAGGAEGMLVDLHRRIARIEQLFELVPLLLAQVVDPTHLSIERAAEALHVSMKTIRRRIRAGTLTLEVVPGTRISGIPIEQLYAEWIDLRTARLAFERECRPRRS
jgi:hypothetical protein